MEMTTHKNWKFWVQKLKKKL